MSKSEVVTREDLANIFGALGEGSYGTRIDSLESQLKVNKNISVGTSQVSCYRCTGTIAETPYIYTNEEGTLMYMGGRIRINSFTRSSGNPGVQFQTSLRPSNPVYLCNVGIRASNSTVYPEYVYGNISTSGLVTLNVSETYANAPNGTLVLILFEGLIPVL